MYEIELMSRSISVRHAAVQVVYALDSDRGSLTTLLPLWSERVDPSERALLQEMCFGVARWSHRLGAVIEQLLKKPLRKKDKDVQALLKIGLYQLEYMRVPDHAALNKTVAVAAEMRKPWAKALVNGTLRSWLRDGDAISKRMNQESVFSFPPWMLDQLKQDWPDEWQNIARSSNEKAPMTLRVNLQRECASAYLAELDKRGLSSLLLEDLDTAIELETPVSVEQLPGFLDGKVSVQDASAQRATPFLSPQKNELILDACAAPGGKTCHMLEFEPSIKIVALDISQERLQRVKQNLDRLGYGSSVKLICADAALVDEWWDGNQFDSIMLDAPCSGTGVIRRHPDIKLTRRTSDIEELVRIQRSLLFGLWKLLKPGGRLLYATCSVFKAENEEQIQFFLEQTVDASVSAIKFPEGALDRRTGVQVLPGGAGGDGFFYSLLKKSES